MQELIVSMVRFSAAMTLFGIQQMQDAVGVAVDTQAALNRFRATLDAVTNAVAAQLDENKKPTLDSMSNLGTDLVNRTWDTMNVNAMDPRSMLQTTGEMMRKTTDSIGGLMRKAPDAAAASEPKPAAEALAATN